MGGIVCSKSVKVAGDKFDEAIIEYMRKKYNLAIGERTAENIKISIGTATVTEKLKYMEVKGRDLLSGSPKTVEISSEEVREALEEPASLIVEAIKQTLEKTPPELASDIVDNGIVMTGGGSLLANLDQLIREKTELPVMLADDPLTCVVLGSGKALSDPKFLRALETE